MAPWHHSAQSSCAVLASEPFRRSVFCSVFARFRQPPPHCRKKNEKPRRIWPGHANARPFQQPAVPAAPSRPGPQFPSHLPRLQCGHPNKTKGVTGLQFSLGAAKCGRGTSSVRGTFRVPPQDCSRAHCWRSALHVRRRLRYIHAPKSHTDGPVTAGRAPPRDGRRLSLTRSPPSPRGRGRRPPPSASPPACSPWASPPASSRRRRRRLFRRSSRASSGPWAARSARQRPLPAARAAAPSACRRARRRGGPTRTGPVRRRRAVVARSVAAVASCVCRRPVRREVEKGRSDRRVVVSAVGQDMEKGRSDRRVVVSAVVKTWCCSNGDRCWASAVRSIIVTFGRES